MPRRQAHERQGCEPEQERTGQPHSKSGQETRWGQATERLNAGVQEYHLAKNMGTSVAMLEKHYGHTSTVGNVRELTKQRRGAGAVVDWEWLAA